MSKCNCGCEKEATYGDWIQGHWNRGKKRSEEFKNHLKNIMPKVLSSDIVKKKISTGVNKAVLKGKAGKKNKGRILSQEHKTKISKNNARGFLGKNHSEETKNKMSLAKENYIPWNKGIEHSKIRGDKNPAWQGGKSFELYGRGFTKELKEKIRKRDNYECQYQGCDRTMFNSDMDFPVHHIDYDKKNHNEDNLILLCNSCHAKSGFKRAYWLGFYSALIYQKYLRRSL